MEIEYAIVDSDYRVAPIADNLLADMAGEMVGDWENGPIAWSNELAAHVIEFKTNGPSSSLEGLASRFQENIHLANKSLLQNGCALMPGGVHPTMDPFRELKLWPHDSNEIYELYHSVFDCRGHGWANLQSVHLNLPFDGDEEFARLHAAVRLILPLIPALASSSPVLDGRLTGFHDSRLEHYRRNQERIPSIAGMVIPERAFSEQEYEDKVFAPIRRDIAPYDPDKILDKYFLNSRGAIARFDRGSIEIRLIDTQECPAADLSIIRAVALVLKNLVDENWSDLDFQKNMGEKELAPILWDTVRLGENATIDHSDYLKALGQESGPLIAGELWKKLLSGKEEPMDREIQMILNQGTLATRMIQFLGPNFTSRRLSELCGKLSRCLAEGGVLLP